MLFANQLLIQCDEALNNKQRKAAMQLKALVTDPEQVIEPKGLNSYKVPNHARLFFTSNNAEDALYMSSGLADRRYTVLHVNAKYAPEKQLPYWSNFIRWLTHDDNRARIHRYLLGHIYDRDGIRRPLDTEAKRTMAHGGMDIFDAWLWSMVSRCHPLNSDSHRNWFDTMDYDDDGKRSSSDRALTRDSWPQYVSGEALARDYAAHARSQYHTGRALNGNDLIQRLRQRGLLKERSKLKRARVNHSSSLGRMEVPVHARVHVYQMPSMEQIQRFLLQRHGIVAEAGEIIDDEHEVVSGGDRGNDF